MLGNSSSMLAVAATTGTVTVKADTVDASKKQVNGCEVWYVAYLNKNNSAFYYSYSQLSTPTSEALVVGNYEMWAAKAGVIGPKRKISVSSTSGTQSVDLLAP